MRKRLVSKRTQVALAIVALAMVGVGAWWYLRPVPRHYQVVSLSAHTWILPIAGNTVYGTPGHWRLQNGQGEVRILVRSGKVDQIGTYLRDSCAEQAGSATQWQWVTNSHHQEARIQIGHCRVDLRLSGE